jgi:hypothetical protein
MVGAGPCHVQVIGTRVTAQIIGGESVYSQFNPFLEVRKLLADEGWDALGGR